MGQQRARIEDGRDWDCCFLNRLQSGEHGGNLSEILVSDIASPCSFGFTCDFPQRLPVLQRSQGHKEIKKNQEINGVSVYVNLHPANGAVLSEA